MPDIDNQGKFCVWFHAVSVGETKAIASLVKKFREKLPDALLIISNITETGHKEAENTIKEADYHIYLPFDFIRIIRPLLKKAQPNIVIISETDFWYNFLNEAKKLGAQNILVNGKLSQKSAKRLRFFKTFARHLFSLFDLLCIQNIVYEHRFHNLGISLPKLLVTGNLKFDAFNSHSSEEEIENRKRELKISQDNFLVTIGSTHSPEESEILEKLRGSLEEYPFLKILLVPRHPERFNKVDEMLKDSGIPYSRYSTGVQENSRVILMDAMGILNKCYEISDIAIVAGSFTEKVGGHNIIEPCNYGVPVLFGPHMFSQPELVKLIKEYNAGMEVTLDSLSNNIRKLLSDSKEIEKIGHKGLLLVQDMRGSTGRTFQEIEQLLTFQKLDFKYLKPYS